MDTAILVGVPTIFGVGMVVGLVFGFVLGYIRATSETLRG